MNGLSLQRVETQQLAKQVVAVVRRNLDCERRHRLPLGSKAAEDGRRQAAGGEPPRARIVAPAPKLTLRCHAPGRSRAAGALLSDVTTLHPTRDDVKPLHSRAAWIDGKPWWRS